MAEKSAIFEEIKDKINKIVLGNRYIISEFEKLKEAIEKLPTNLPNVIDPGKELTEIKDKLDSLSDLTKLGKAVKNLKPTINELNETMKSMSELKKTLDDIKKSVTTLGDLKVLTSELKMTMAEIRETSKIMKISVPAAAISLPKTKPIIKPIVETKHIIKPIVETKPISNSISIEQKTISSQPLSKGPLKASSMYKLKKTTPTTETTTKLIETEPTIVKPIIIKPITTKLTKSEPPIIKPITEESIKEEPLKKKGKVHPIVLEIFRLIKQRAQSGESAEALSKHIENARDTITKSWKWHPALLELGTFSRKLKKLPPEKPPPPDVIKILLEKLEEWKAKMT